MEVPVRPRTLRFGAFEVDLRSGELRKYGLRVKLQDQPFQILALLLERPGEVVTREELQRQLWPADTFVDFDVGLNTAVKRLRDALGDTADSPRYVETLHRRGYRFVASVEDAAPAPLSDAAHRDSTQATVFEPAAPTAETPAAPLVEHRRRLPRVALLALAGILAAVVGLNFGGLRYRLLGILRPKSYTIAVLPFKNLSSEPDSDYFSDGLTGEIIHNLSIIDGLEVKSQTSSFFFKDKPRNIHDVGAQLGVNLVLEGSVLRSGERLRINTQLIRVSDDVPLWSGHFDRELKDVFAIQDEISRSIVNELRLKLDTGQRRYNTNLEAYDLYLKADTMANLHSRELRESIDLFERVITKDPDFAPAYAGLAIAYADVSVSPRSFSPDLAYPKMRAAAEKAMQLDPLLPEAYAGLGLVSSRDRQWQQAEKAFRRSIQLNPRSSRSHVDFAVWVLFSLGRFEEAVQELRTALRLDPLSMSVRNALNWVLLSDGRYDEVLESCRAIPRKTGNLYVMHIQQVCARAMLQKGRKDEAIAILEEQSEKGGPGFLGYAYATVGRRAEAEQVAAKYPDWPWAQALVYAGLGDKDRALESLKKMADIHDPRIDAYLTYPEFALLHSDPRFSELREKLKQPITR